MHGNLANPALDGLSEKTALLSEIWTRFHDKFGKLFPVKTVQYLSEFTGLSYSASEKSLREKRALSGDALISLLDTPAGAEAVLVLTAHSKQPWAKEFRRMYRRQQIKNEIADLEKRLADLNAGLGEE